MNLHEYQAKKILATFGVKVPYSINALNIEETVYAAKKVFKKTKEYICVIKAQIHAGGRGKGGGIKISKYIDDVYKKSSKILGRRLVTNQTNNKGKIVNKVLISEYVFNTEKENEYYISIFYDRNIYQNRILYSKEGGLEIESKYRYKKIFLQKIDPYIGIQDFLIRKIAFNLKIKYSAFIRFKTFIRNIYNAYIYSDASLLEINPVFITKNNEILAIDAKVILDDNALFRHMDYKEMYDEKEYDLIELEAKKAGLNYLKLDGEVACMVNGAGLAMSTMDMIKLYGANPANFLDLGGKADSKCIKKGFDIILKDKKVKIILINIFGGIVRCDIVAEGIINYFNKSINKKIILRLEGTNVNLAKKLINNSNSIINNSIIYVTSLEEAANKIII
ncbi:succinyl-CoA synthetase beta subunit [Candidatus Sulcia muelleri str. Hc (Homalodisca coagulata)]|uniref:Succinate--CoA ligase [ADP-forming] subunit beta n=2 Tax=cellular organisms TaxID=131567 RepID=A8Z5U7_KARMG|nr:succinyl-CoA synthetase beta subunit [Candidatus Karelsulcia muelleri GWSS]EAT14130.1 succinyl-CoA synthetase beta subunit [Candidatus Karelsulcia muelleri str. Hc (Homalodisca coagulata)]MBS0018849.1 ADP-forming succinate--CoA ligase subunit beta [Candidatus Karelsulcia muelleri]